MYNGLSAGNQNNNFIMSRILRDYMWKIIYIIKYSPVKYENTYVSTMIELIWTITPIY